MACQKERARIAILSCPAYLLVMPMEPVPDLADLSLAQIAMLMEDKKLPPVDKWNPAHCGHSDMRIAADGTWFHQGSPIGRAEMVRLFSTILRREADGSFVLVTPVEKLTIDVEDAPFVAVELREEREGAAQMLAFRLNIGEIVVADDAHPIIIRRGENGPRPYLHVRGGLEAAIARPVYYELAAMALDGALGRDGQIGVWSGSAFFPLEAIDDSP